MGKTAKKHRSHIKIHLAPKHNMEPTVRIHRKLLEETAVKLAELEIPFSFSNVTDEFTQELAVKGIHWVKHPCDAVKDFKSACEALEQPRKHD